MAQPRFYIRIAKNIYSDRKLAGLTDAEKWAWIALLCAADDSKVPGTLPEPVEDMAYRLHTDEATLRGCIEKLLVVDRPPLYHDDDGMLTVANWSDHQGRKKSPSEENSAVAERMRRYRENLKNKPVTDVTGVTDVTPVTTTQNIPEQNRREIRSSNTLRSTSTPAEDENEPELPTLRPLQQFTEFRLSTAHYQIAETLFGFDRAETRRNTEAWKAHRRSIPDKAIADFNADWQSFLDRRFRFDRQDAETGKARANGNGRPERLPDAGVWILPSGAERPKAAGPDYLRVSVNGYVDWFPPDKLPAGAKEWKG